MPRAIRAVVAAGRPLLRLLPVGFRQRYRGEIVEAVDAAVSDAFARGGTAAGMSEGVRQWSDVAVTGIRLRLRAVSDPARKSAGLRAGVLVAGAAAVAVMGSLPALERGSPSPGASYAELVVSAHDPAGHFSLTLRHGRLIAGTLDDEPLPRERLRQHGDQLQLIGADGAIALAVRFEAPGVIRWEPRTP